MVVDGYSRLRMGWMRAMRAKRRTVKLNGSARWVDVLRSQGGRMTILHSINKCNDEGRKLSNHIPLRDLVFEDLHTGNLLVVADACRPDDEDGSIAIPSRTAWAVPWAVVVMVPLPVAVWYRSFVSGLSAFVGHGPVSYRVQVWICLELVLLLW